MLSSCVLVDHQFCAERVFQIYWLIVNLILTASCLLIHFVPGNIFPGYHRNEDHLFIVTLMIGAGSGILSFSLFFVSRTREEKETHVVKNIENTSESPQRLYEKAHKDIGRKNGQQQGFKRDWSGLWALVDYPMLLISVVNHFFKGNPVWGTLQFFLAFLPGFAWYSKKDLVSFTNS